MSDAYKVIREGRWPSGADKPAATLALTVEEMMNRTGASFHSGADDLGPFSQLGLQLPSGRLVLLQHYELSPSENLDVYIDSRDNAADALEEFCLFLQLPREKLEWKAPEAE